MSAIYETVQPAAAASKPLWAAVAVLGVAVLAMGATLIHIQTRPEEPHAAVLAATVPAATPAAAVTPAPGPALALASSQAAPQKKAEAGTSHSSGATKYAANRAGRPVASSATPDQSRHPAPRSVCANCGTVTSVTPIQRDGAASGGGAIAGGVLGAVVGNQVGGGNGKTVATILGAVGGGFAGNAVEKKMKKETVYQVQVRMEDGSTRTLEQATAAAVGAKVTVEGRTLQPAGR